MKLFQAMLLIGLAGQCVAADAPVFMFRSSGQRTALLEMFTSEGCSSCPPAEEWLARQKKSGGLWRDFVPVAFHVDYWDYLGWRDPWSSPEFTRRQEVYGAEWQARSIYTPGFALDGREWRGWGGTDRSPKSSGGPAGSLEVASTNGTQWRIEFSPKGKGPARYEVCIALLDSGLVSDVKAGENEGRKLRHDFVALALAKGRLVEKEGAWSTTIHFPSNGRKPKGRAAIAAWVSAGSSQAPLQAVGGWIAPEQ